MAHYSDLYGHYSALADKLDYQAKKSGSQLGIFAGGINKTRIKVVRSNNNRVEPSFRRDRFLNPPDSDEYT